MKNFLLILLLFCTQVSVSQTKISEEEKIRSFIEVWGLLKYHHPQISRGKQDMNQEFIREIDRMGTTESREEFNEQLLAWVKSFGAEDFKSKENWKKKQELFAENADFDWIVNSKFSPQLEELLQEIRYNTNYKDNYASVKRWSSHVSFEKDLPPDNFEDSKRAHRLLFLAHFWNAMKYWNPNVYLTDTPWSRVLFKMIPEFDNEDATGFETAKEKLFSKLNDSHSNYFKSKSLNALTHYPNFGGRIINDSLVVTRLFNEEFAKKDNISVGDVIYSVEGTELKTYYNNNFSEVISSSNENHLKKTIENTFLLASNKDSIRVGIFRKNGKSCEQYIRLSKLEHWRERYTRSQPAKMVSQKRISEEIGYLNLNYITNEELKSAFEEFSDTKGIILDLRNYPRNISSSSLPKYLYPRRRQFIEVLTSSSLPGYGQPDTKAATRLLMDPFSAGKRNTDYNKGKIILLVDRRTLSNAEYIAMAIQTAPNVTTIGEQTGGAVLNRNQIQLMDRTSIDFTRAGAFYPSGENVQRKGLKIDLEIQESARDYNKDLYLETAIDLIEENNF